MDLTYIYVAAAALAAWLITKAVFGGRETTVSEADMIRRLTGRTGEAAPSTKTASGLVGAGSAKPLTGVATVLAKPLEGSEYDRNQLSLQLAQAGIRNPSAVTIFLAAKIVLALIGLVIGFFLYRSFGPDFPKWYDPVAWSLGGLCIGFFLPGLWLRIESSNRIDKITKSIPDSLDMLVVMVEAGLGLDAAIQRCADEMATAYPEISEEWKLAAKETQMGLTRSEALRKMAERTGAPDMQAMVATLTQAERFGTSVAQALRIQAEALRIKRRQKAEEKAAKTAVKLIFPLILFIFPAIFIVLGGPAVVKILDAFKPQ